MRHDDYVADETRGESVRRRRNALRMTQAELAVEAGVSEPTIRNLEGDKTDQMRKSASVLTALDRLEAERHMPSAPPARRRSDTPQRRALEALIETTEGEQVAIRLLGDGTRAIFVVPEGGRIPSDAEIEAALRQARGEE